MSQRKPIEQVLEELAAEIPAEEWDGLAKADRSRHIASLPIHMTTEERKEFMLRLEAERQCTPFDYDIHEPEDWPEDWVSRGLKEKEEKEASGNTDSIE